MSNTANVVVTRQPNWNENGAQPARNISEALHFCEHKAHVWVIGGAQIYAQALPLAHSVVVTEIGANFEGDAFAPELGPEWREIARENLMSAQGLPLSFVTYQKIH